jgi:predicted RNase H-like HicB family nuclease
LTFDFCLLCSELALLRGLWWDMSMKKIIQVHIYKGDKYYIAECLDLPVVTQGETLDELVFNLKEAINLQLEGENLSDFDLVAEPSILANLEVDSSVYAKT